MNFNDVRKDRGMSIILERPIIFSTLMVRAILAGEKTQTRRIVKPQPRGILISVPGSKTGWVSLSEHGRTEVPCPFFVGQQLWVRESFSVVDGEVIYRADGEYPDGPTRWKPSIHMPRGYCRITLAVLAVKAVRLQSITYDDARAEGVEPKGGEFAAIWDKINGAGSWDSNPWVWAVTFAREPAHER